jgi:hypothetical protein
VEGATADEVFACLSQLYIAADNLYNVGSLFDFLNEIRVKFFSWGGDCRHSSHPLGLEADIPVVGITATFSASLSQALVPNLTPDFGYTLIFVFLNF